MAVISGYGVSLGRHGICASVVGHHDRDGRPVPVPDGCATMLLTYMAAI